MTLSQKLGILTGISTPLVGSIYWLYLIYQHGVYNEVLRGPNDFMVVLGIPWIFAFFFALAAYYHAVRRSILSVLVLLVFWVLVVAGFGLIGFFIFIWGGFAASGVVFSPVVTATLSLAILTIFRDADRFISQAR
jgi:hypothetical protein